MKILTNCYEFPPLGGGGAKVVHGLSTNLAELGHEVDIVTMGYKCLQRHEVVKRVNVFRIPGIRSKKSMCYTPEMIPYVGLGFNFSKNLVRKEKYLINHTHFIFPDGIIAYLLKKKTGLPYMITAHGSDVPGYNPNRFCFQHKLLLPLWRKITREAELVICPSSKLESLILQHDHKIKTCVIPNGFDVNKFDPYQTKQKRILVVTRMFKRKGIQYFFDALKRFRSDYEVDIVGDGPYLRSLHVIAERLKIKAKFWGFLDNQSRKLKKLFETATIFVFPSESENFPTVLLEAMAAGTAIITTKGTGCAEVVGDSALLVDPKNSGSVEESLIRLTRSHELCNELGRAARIRLENNFSWESVTKQYVDVYKNYANCK